MIDFGAINCATHLRNRKLSEIFGFFMGRRSADFVRKAGRTGTIELWKSAAPIGSDRQTAKERWRQPSLLRGRDPIFKDFVSVLDLHQMG
jgi:hypothetical protein